MKGFRINPNPSYYGDRLVWLDVDVHKDLIGTLIDWETPPTRTKGWVELSKEEAQALMDELWCHRVRPSKTLAPEVHVDYKHEAELAKAAANGLEAEKESIQAHLKDMRAVAFHALEIDEREK